MNQIITYTLLVASSVASTIWFMYQFFVPRGEAKEYRISLDKRISSIENLAIRAISRETLDDVISPIKEDLREIKQMLREGR